LGPSPTEAAEFREITEARQRAEHEAETLKRNVAALQNLSNVEEETKSVVREKDAEIEILKAKIAMLENVDDPKRDELVQKINEQNVARLEATIASLKAEKAQMQEEFKELRVSVLNMQQLEDEKGELSRRVMSLTAEIATLKASGSHVASESEVALGADDMQRQIRSMEEMYEKVQRDFQEHQKKHTEVEAELEQTRGLYRSASQEHLQVQQKLKETEESKTEVAQKLQKEIAQVKAVHESAKAKLAELYKFWGDVSYSVTKKNNTFKFKNAANLALELTIEPKDYTLRELIDEVGKLYATKSAQVVSPRKSTVA